MNFQKLPTVLQDMVCEFAWKTNWDHVRLNMEQLFRIKKYNMPPIFFRGLFFSAEYGCYLPNPLLTYTPIFNLISLFNKHRIHELLYKLDFRKRDVKCLGSRWEWVRAMDHSYENILQFGMFYKMLLASRKNIWTPTYRSQLEMSGPDHLI